MAKKHAIDASLTALAGKLIESLSVPISAEDEILIVTGAAVLGPEVRTLTPLKDQTILFYESASAIAAQVQEADPATQHIGSNFITDEDRVPASIILGVVLTDLDGFGDLLTELHNNLLPGGQLGLIVHPDNLQQDVRGHLHDLGAVISSSEDAAVDAYLLITLRTPTEEELQAQEKDDTPPVQSRRDTLTVVHRFSAEEIYEHSKHLAAKTQELSALKLEKAASASSYAARIKQVETEIGELSTKVANGDETRDVDVEITYNHPEPGFKTVKRLDNEKEEVKRMDYEEKQRYAPTLFDEANLVR